MALEVKRVLAEEAKQKQIAAGGDKSSKSYLMQAIDSKEKALPEKIPEALSLDKHAQNESREKAASLVGGTNARYIQDAEKIEREAPEVKALVMAGTVNMADAVKLTKLEPAKRAVAVERVLAEEAKERQIENGKNNALNLTQFQECRNQEKIPDSGDVKPEPQARDKAASIVGNTNARYVQDAKKIEREAPEVKALVMSGTVNMADAVKLTKLEPAKRATFCYLKMRKAVI